MRIRLLVMKYSTLPLLAVLGLGLVTGCSSEEAPISETQPKTETASTPEAPASTLDPEMVKKGKQLFITKACASCHGETGKGDGIAAAALDPKPRNYTDKAWQASTTDEHIKKVIMEGGAANGLSQMMPANAAMFADASDLDAVVAYIRSLGQ